MGSPRILCDLPPPSQNLEAGGGGRGRSGERLVCPEGASSMLLWEEASYAGVDWSFVNLLGIRERTAE